MRPALRAAALLLLALAPGCASAWGGEGHAAVGAQAERALSPGAQRRARELLGGARLSDPAVASWADLESADGRAPRAFHYVNVPLGARGYDPARDCRHGRCVVAKLEQELAALGDPAQPRERRADALRWVVHLVGDLHQPLHCADCGDRGGNDTRVFRPGPDTNLHAVWDGLPARCDVGARAAAEQPSRGSPGPAGGGPRQWVDECHALARDVYAEALSHETGRGLRLDRLYRRRQCALVERQLTRAGARLAAVLERALGSR